MSVDFLGNFDSNEELARKLSLVVAQIVGGAGNLPPASVRVLDAAVQRLKDFGSCPVPSTHLGSPE